MKTSFRFAALALLLSACTTIIGPREVVVPLSDLQRNLDRRFPFTSSYLEVFNIDVGRPRLSLQPETNRVVATVDAAIASPVSRLNRKASFILSGVLAIDPFRRAVVLTEPRMDSFSIEGMDSYYNKQIAKVGDLLAEQILRSTPIYSFSADEFRYAGVVFLPTKINTRSDGLVVTFEPAK